MKLGVEYIEKELRCPYCNSDKILNIGRLEGASIYYWISCGKCGRNFQVKKKDEMFFILNADEAHS